MVKINWIGTLTALSISALFSYGVYLLGKSQEEQTILCTVTAIESIISLMLLFGLDYENRSGMMVKGAVCAYMAVDFIVNFVLRFFDFSAPLFIISNGILLIIFLLVSLSVLKTKM